MALANVRLEELPTFGRRLMELAKEKNLGSPTLLSNELYYTCRDLVNPAPRKNKYGKVVKDEAHDKEAIKRIVQQHFNEEDVCKVQSKYLLAYSRILGCSLDYLYGVADIRSCNLEVREICEKLHLNESVVINMIEGYDEDPDVFSSTRFWSEILSGDLFHELPSAWLMYSMQVLEFQDLAKKIEAIRKAEKEANDEHYRTMMEVRRIALEKMQPGKSSDCEGAFRILMKLFTKYMDEKAEKWADSRHVDFEDNYYDNELKKIEILEAALKEGSRPATKNE